MVSGRFALYKNLDKSVPLLKEPSDDHRELFFLTRRRPLPLSFRYPISLSLSFGRTLSLEPKILAVPKCYPVP